MGSLINKLTSFIDESSYTRKIIPNKEMDSALKKILKWALIILTLGLAFIVPLTMDFAKKTFQQLFSKKQPPIKPPPPVSPSPALAAPSTASTSTESSTSNASTTTDAANIAPSAEKRPPLTISSQGVVISIPFQGFSKENASKFFQGLYDGVKIPFEISKTYLSNSRTDRYKNIGYLIASIAPYWLARGIISRSILSIAFVGGGFAIDNISVIVSKHHNKIMTPPKERNE